MIFSFFSQWQANLAMINRVQTNNVTLVVVIFSLFLFEFSAKVLVVVKFELKIMILVEMH